MTPDDGPLIPMKRYVITSMLDGAAVTPADLTSRLLTGLVLEETAGT